MLRIFLILSLAVSLAGVVFSFVLKDKVQTLSGNLQTAKADRDNAIAESTQAKAAEKKAKDAEKLAKDELETTRQDLASKSALLTDNEKKLSDTATDLEKTKVERDTAQRRLASWEATGIQPNQILALKAEAARLVTERDAFAEEKKVMGREIVRLNEELDVYRGKINEVIMPDVRGQVTAVDGNYRFVMLDIGTEDGLKQNGKMIVTRGDALVAKVQLVRVEPRSAVGNLLPDWMKGDVKAGDQVITSYEALAR